MDQNMSAIEAMELSAQEDRVVHLMGGTALAHELAADCDGSASDADRESCISEFWGDDWRVTLHWRDADEHEAFLGRKHAI